MMTLLSLLPLLLSTAVAEQDSTYWPPGKSNPNVKNKMYYHDSMNVLQDLNKFARLYVVYHNCAWSPFGTPANDDENLAFESYWYLGLTQTYRANAAYSLYGVFKGKQNTGCHSGTFINSFFTNYGAQHFLDALQMNGYLGGYQGGNRRKLYNYNQNGNDDGNNNDDGSGAFDIFSSTCSAVLGNDGQIDDGNIPEYGASGYPNAVSYTLGCSENQKFEYHSFTGATCDSHQFIQVEDELEEANQDLQSTGCALLYDYKAKYNYGDDDGGYGYQYTGEYDDQFWDNYANQGWGNYGEEGESVPELKHPLDLLKYSHTCSIALFPFQCPDPFGKVEQYLDQLQRGTRTIVYMETEGSWRKRNTPWIFMTIAGFMCLITSLAMDGKLKHPRKWKVEPKDFGVDDESRMGRTIATVRSRFINLVGKDEKEVIVDTTDMAEPPAAAPVEMAISEEIDEVEKRLNSLKTGKSKEASATPQKKESTFGAFGAMMGLESPQPLNQGVEAVRSPTQKPENKLV